MLIPVLGTVVHTGRVGQVVQPKVETHTPENFAVGLGFENRLEFTLRNFIAMYPYGIGLDQVLPLLQPLGVITPRYRKNR